MSGFYEADKWYQVKGEDLVLIRYGLYSLMRDVREDHLSADSLVARLKLLKDMLPENPPVINEPPI